MLCFNFGRMTSADVNLTSLRTLSCNSNQYLTSLISVSCELLKKWSTVDFLFLTRGVHVIDNCIPCLG